MKRISKPFAALSAFAALLAACGEPLMNEEPKTEMPVVESYLQEGANSITVKIYSMEAYLKDGSLDLSKPVKGLDVLINGIRLDETSSGVYQLTEQDTLREGQEYRLQFEYGSRRIEASAQVPPAIRNLCIDRDTLTLSSSSYYWGNPDTTGITVSWDDAGGSYYQVYIESPNTPDIPSAGIFGRRVMQPFRGNSYRAQAGDFRSAGIHWICVYRVNTDYAELYNRISSSDLADPVSYIDNAFGIFTALSAARVSLRVYESSE
jgi:hypothetical protein